MSMSEFASNIHSRRSLVSHALSAGGLVAAGMLVSPAEAAPLPTSSDEAFNVKRFGAKGDGKTDDTAFVQSAIDSAIKAGGGRVHFPSGRYRITKTLLFDSLQRIDVTGDGWTSILMHEADEHLLLWPENVSCRNCSVRNLAIAATNGNKSRNVAAIACLGGAEQSFFSHLLINGDGGNPSCGILVEKVMDTTTLDNCLMWGVTGTGLTVAQGSQVIVLGGRVIGSRPIEGDQANDDSIGIHVTGGNGGVHVISTDLIGLHTAMKIGQPGNPSNREIFITHATFDSSDHGLVQTDHSYTSIAGCWSASSDEEQILIDSTATGAILAITGGTIFNGGAYGRGGANNGIVVRAGSFMLSGVTVRHNKGTGILIDSDNVRDYAITGCRIADNGTGAVLAGHDYAFTGNVLTRNGRQLIDNGKGEKQVANNVIVGQ